MSRPLQPNRPAKPNPPPKPATFRCAHEPDCASERAHFILAINEQDAHIAELEAVVNEVRRLRLAFVNSGTTVSFGPLWRALDSLENPSSHE